MESMTIRIPRELMRKLKRKAKEQDRSANSMIQRILRKYLESGDAKT